MNAYSSARYRCYTFVATASVALCLLSVDARATIVFEDDFTGPGGSVEGRSTDGSTAAVNGTYFNANADIVYTDGVSGMTGVNPATQTGNFGTAAIDILAGGDLDLENTDSIVTATLQINSNRTSDGGNGAEFGTVFVQFDDVPFQGVNNTTSGPAFAFQSLGAPFLLYKPGLSFDVFVSSDNGNGTPAFLEEFNTIELIYNTATYDMELRHNGTLVHAAPFDAADATELLFWNRPSFESLFFQFNNTNWLVDSISLDVSPIPEPGTAVLFGLGLSVVALGRRRLYSA
ncbi:PEP-CTERM sorting domain-containing protein [Aeoliella sp. ICT_H6.2]|uniref:PEP-CTERM sorting domain-containing protein n=1 Tax=Aeoliella straminimaris TaxID=2954799 RepID=A0A9X2FIB5_9BACT|nr:PEP-CTERM sorting domain-containing protein [Aeoliella straminimaris]MCO6046956.1 PEP-CTERM sorting domain-containing protein [Aeoliella straminimaris]